MASANKSISKYFYDPDHHMLAVLGYRMREVIKYLKGSSPDVWYNVPWKLRKDTPPPPPGVS
jgi:hypothetical protein